MDDDKSRQWIEQDDMQLHHRLPKPVRRDNPDASEKRRSADRNSGECAAKRHHEVTTHKYSVEICAETETGMGELDEQTANAEPGMGDPQPVVTW